ncbi:MAG: hypothetical protein ABTQ34_09895 [Bdellovibrionales bacterium]
MLQARHLRIDDTAASNLSETKGRSVVRRIVPNLQPVAVILTGETGPYGGRPDAVVYPMPDGELVCLRLMDNNDYDYDQARLLLKDHSIVRAYLANPNEEIKAIASPQDIEGPQLAPKDIKWLKSKIESQHKRAEKELKAQGLIL